VSDSLARNIRTVRSLIEDVWNDGRVELLEQLLTPDRIDHDPGRREPREARLVARHRRAFPDHHQQITDVVAAGDRVVARWTAAGTHLGEFRGIGPTGRTVQYTGIGMHRLVDARIAETWAQWDELGLIRQLTEPR